MRVLVLGADGMLGHQLTSQLVISGHDVVGTTRRSPSRECRRLLEGARLVCNVDARVLDSIASIFLRARPDVVINCIGIVKQRAEAKDALESIRVNSLFPHQLRLLCGTAGARLIHISTDCVFSGTVGSYTEDDMPDPVDLYGRSKLLGEIDGEGVLTLRTSIVGLELTRADSLVEWLLRQTGTIPGWTRAIYSGLTTQEFSRLIIDVLLARADLHGLWHVSSEPISKYDLLSSLITALNRDIVLRADDAVRIDRSLNSNRFRKETGYLPPPWTQMITELAADALQREDSLGV